MTKNKLRRACLAALSFHGTVKNDPILLFRHPRASSAWSVWLAAIALIAAMPNS
jgi:hypothetical protein